jgi:hypothetical protein
VSVLARGYDVSESWNPRDPLIERRVRDLVDEETGVGADSFLSVRRRSKVIGTESTETRELTGKTRLSVTDISRDDQGGLQQWLESSAVRSVLVTSE